MKSPLVDEAVGQLEELSALAASVARDLAGEIAEVAERVRETLETGGKLLFCGNGGSAADAQHLATEYIVRFRRDRAPMPALALTTDTSLLTAASNDFGFDAVFELQVRALARPGDLLFLHSTSGASANLLRAARAAREIGAGTVGLLARGGGELRGLVDVALVVPTDSAARAQELHLTIGHIICEIVESRLFPENRPVHD